MQYLITFMSSGGLVVEADNEDEARDIFESTMQEDAGRELAANGIDITEVCIADE